MNDGGGGGGRHRLVVIAVAVTVLLVAAGCAKPSVPQRGLFTPATPIQQDAYPAGSRPRAILLASSFERPVCGMIFDPGPDCEFGIHSDVSTGPFEPRTGRSAARLQRFHPGGHLHVGEQVALPGARGYVGAAHRVPALPPMDAFIQLMQVTPGDRTVDASVVEVRLYGDRRLGIASYQGAQVARTRWRVPVDRWFYVVVKIAYGRHALQRLWVYDARDELIESVTIRLDTTGDYCCRARQTIGGTVSTSAPVFTYADDWYVATRNLGPLRIGPDGVPI